MLKVHQYTTTCLPTFIQIGTAQAMNTPACLAEMERMRKVFENRRDLLQSKLDSITDITYVPVQGAFYLLVDISNFRMNDVEFAERLLEEKGVAVVPVETQQAIKNLDEILSVQGIDMIFIGPSDLSQSFGVPGKTKHPQVIAAIESIIEKAKKPIGFFCGNIEDSKHWAEKGIQMFLAGSQALIAQACANYVDAFNANVKK